MTSDDRSAHDEDGGDWTTFSGATSCGYPRASRLAIGQTRRSEGYASGHPPRSLSN